MEKGLIIFLISSNVPLCNPLITHVLAKEWVNQYKMYTTIVKELLIPALNDPFMSSLNAMNP